MLIGIAVGIVLWFVWLYKTRDNVYRDTGPVGLVCLIGGLLFGILLVTIPVAVFLPNKVNVEHQMRAMTDGTSTSGSFFLGSGTIHGDPAFTYYEVGADGRSRLKDVDADYASVVEYEGAPKVVQECDDWSHIPFIVAFPANIFAIAGHDCTGEYTFYVPTGSIKDGYVLDAQ